MTAITKTINKAAVLLLILLFVFTFPPYASVKAETKTIIVPDQYPLIQDAIDSANSGDTIFVKSGVYYETLTINKTLTLIGEDREHTIIDAHKITANVVHVTVGGVSLINFTLGHTGYIFSSGGTPPAGVYTEGGNTCVINNTIVDVHGPAFKVGFNSGSFLLQNNIVSNSGFVLFTGIFSYNLSESEAVEIPDLPSPFPADISVLKENEVLHLTRTKGASLGDLVLKDNATLIVDNFTAKAQSLHATNNSRIILKNDAFLYVHQISGGTSMRIYLSDNALLNSTDSSTVRIVCKDESRVLALNSKLYIEAYGNALVVLDNCTNQIMASENANVTVNDSPLCSIGDVADEAQIWVSNSYVTEVDSTNSIGDKSNLWIVNSTYVPADMVFKGESNTWLINCDSPNARYWCLSESSSLWVINSTWNQKRYLTFYDQPNLWFINSKIPTNEAQEITFKTNDAKVRYCYFLSVNVKSLTGALLENMNVEVYHSNGTLVDQKRTNSKGNAQFILAVHIWQNETNEYFTQYLVKAYGADFEENTITVSFDSNKERTLELNAADQFPTTPETVIILVIAVTCIIGLVAFWASRKKKRN
ncbi:MAG: hypothetical protein WC325_08885 [Candidatus Bathyarchaeia archaeon]|jgi:hypothetical protein